MLNRQFDFDLMAAYSGDAGDVGADLVGQSQQVELEQWMTPEWAAEELLAHYFGDLTSTDQLLEPSCGDGAFLRVVPRHVPAIGVEIDPVLAAQARMSSGREVFVGDFCAMELPVRPTVIVGNPPFRLVTVKNFLDRAWDLLPDDGRAGFILPASVFQTASTALELAKRWGVTQDMLPRNVFPRIQAPLCFARFTKGKRGMVGFVLYHETAAVSALQRRYKALLAQGEGSVWSAVTRAAMEALGGTASLSALYREIEGVRPTDNAFWHAKIRQQVQRLCRRVGPGVWSLSDAKPFELTAA